MNGILDAVGNQASPLASPRIPEVLLKACMEWGPARRSSFLTPGYARGPDAAEFVRQRWQKTLAETDCLDDDTPEQKRVRRLTRLNMDWFMQMLLDQKDQLMSRPQTIAYFLQMGHWLRACQVQLL